MPMTFSGAAFPPDPARLSTLNTFLTSQSVVGALSASGVVSDGTNNSLQWDTAYTTYAANSSTYFLKSGGTMTGNLSVAGTIFTSNSANVLSKYSVTIGNASNTVFTINHGLSTTDVMAQVFEVATNAVAYPLIQIPSVSAVTVTFETAPALSAYKVLVFGSVPSNQVAAYGPSSSGFANLNTANTFTSDVTIQGNTQIGDASGDSLTVTAGTVTAPNATAVGPTNIANVGALDQRYPVDGRVIRIDNFAGHASTNLGGNGTSLNCNGAQICCTAGSTAGVYNYASMMTAHNSGLPGKGSSRCYFSVPTTAEVSVGFTGDNQSTAVIQLLAGGIQGTMLQTGHAPIGYGPNLLTPFWQLSGNTLWAVSARTIRHNVAMVRSTNVVSVSTLDPHLLNTGDVIGIGNVDPASFCTFYAQASVANSTTFTYYASGADGRSTTNVGVSINHYTYVGSHTLPTAGAGYSTTDNIRRLKNYISGGTANWYIDSGSGYTLTGSLTGYTTTDQVVFSGLYAVQSTSSAAGLNQIFVTQYQVSY